MYYFITNYFHQCPWGEEGSSLGLFSFSSLVMFFFLHTFFFFMSRFGLFSLDHFWVGTGVCQWASTCLFEVSHLSCCMVSTSACPFFLIYYFFLSFFLVRPNPSTTPPSSFHPTTPYLPLSYCQHSHTCPAWSFNHLTLVHRYAETETISQQDKLTLEGADQQSHPTFQVSDTNQLKWQNPGVHIRDRHINTPRPPTTSSLATIGELEGILIHYFESAANNIVTTIFRSHHPGVWDYTTQARSPRNRCRGLRPTKITS